ncbi:CdaR family transcriptional regulator [Oceanisphaera sp.]|uniref:CdaR family transcriptional regulator n=1 Tax=Oceanisphaera sp. TaxID=1929979 RepID=UPI003A94DE1A
MMEIEGIIAEKIIARTKGLIPYDINVMNRQGRVVASTDTSRVGLVHEGASRVIERREPVIVDQASTRYLTGARPGINLPIEYQGSCIGVVGITGEPQQVCDLGALLKMTAELLVEQSREKDAAQLLNAEREECLKQLVDGRLDETTAQQRVKSLQLQIRYPALCVIIQPESPHRLQQQKLDLTPALNLRVNGLFFYRQGGGLTLILEAGDKAKVDAKIAQLVELLAQPLTIGVGCRVDSLSGLALSYKTATAAMQFGRPEALGETATQYCYDSHKEKVLVSSSAQGWQLAELTKEYRALIEQDPHGTLRLTLHTLISSSADMLSCASQLDIHRNTLRYRLDRIHDITGVDYKKLDQLLRLYLGKIILD